MRTERVREAVRRAIRSQLDGEGVRSGDALVPAGNESGHDFVNERLVLDGRRSGTLFVLPGAIITPLAREMAERYGVLFQQVESLGSERSSSNMTVGVGSDHAGFELKEKIRVDLIDRGYRVIDVGTNTSASVDYPDFAIELGRKVSRGTCERGVFVDGAGIGGAMAANKIPGVRAAHCRDAFEVKNSRAHNDANFLTLGSRSDASSEVLELVRMWLHLAFEGGRHARRVGKINRLDRGY